MPTTTSNQPDPGGSKVDELAAEVLELAHSRNLVLIRALPDRESGFAVYLGDEDMSPSEFSDIAAAVSAKLLYFETHSFNAENDLRIGRRRIPNLRDDSGDRELGALRQEASAYNGLSCEATLGFAANGVMHYWTTVTAWYAQYIDRLNSLQPSENPLIQRMPAAQERDMVARLTKELVQSPEFRSAANAAQRRRVARTQSEIAILLGDPRYEYQQVAFTAIQRANEAVSAEVDATYRALEAGLDSLATEFANTAIFKSTVSARARREHARDFLVEKAGGYPVPGRLLELFLDTAPLQRSKTNRN